MSESKNSPQKLYVSIDLLDPVAATEEELANKEYVSPSAMVDNADDVVVELAHSIDSRLEAMAKEGGYKVPGRGETPPAPMQAAESHM